MKFWYLLATCIVLVACMTTVLCLVGCNGDSAESLVRNVNILVSGVYSNPNGNLVSQNTGQPIVSMNLVQTGENIQGVDNNGSIFKGTIGALLSEEGGNRLASFTLRGRTTAGAEGVISGNLTVNDTTAVMRGTWAEPTLFATVLGEADVPSNAFLPDPGSPGTTNGNGNGSGTNVNIGIPIPR